MTALDFVIVWLAPVGLLVALWLLVSLVVFVAVRSPLDFDFKHDLSRKFEAKRGLPSGTPRLSFGLVARLLAGDNCVQATLLYRISRIFAKRRMRLPGAIVHSFAKFLTHVDISPWADLGRGLYLYHGLGTVIGKGTTIGERALVCQGVTTGGGATLGDDVTLWAGAKVIGRVRVGDRAEVGANAVVVSDVPPDCVAVGVPATRFIPRDGTRENSTPAEPVSSDAVR